MLSIDDHVGYLAPAKFVAARAAEKPIAFAQHAVETFCRRRPHKSDERPRK